MSNVKRGGTYTKNPGPKMSTLDKIMAQRKNNDGNSVSSHHSSASANKRAGSPANKLAPSSVIQVKPSPKSAQKQEHVASPRQPGNKTNDQSSSYQDSKALSPNLDQGKGRERYEQFVNQMSAPQAKPAVQSPVMADHLRDDYQAPSNKHLMASTPQEARKPVSFGQVTSSHHSPVFQHKEASRRSSAIANHEERRVSIHGN